MKAIEPYLPEQIASIMDFQDILSKRRTVREFSSSTVSLQHVKPLIWAAQGITDDDGNRTAPSAHGLHPLSLSLTAGRIEGLPEGIYELDRYSCEIIEPPLETEDRLGDLQDAAIGEQPWITEAAGVITISADMTMSARYFSENRQPMGYRGQRYAFIEAGAAAQNIMLKATELGLGSVLVAGIYDEKTADIIDLPPAYIPILHVCFGWPE